MPSTLKQDLKKLDTLAYHRREYSQVDIQRFHAVPDKKDRESIELLYRWMLTPISLWPMNIHDVFSACLDSLEAKNPLDEEMTFLLKWLPDPPSEEVCRVTMEHEHLVQHGSYESLVKTTAKFDSIENEALRNTDLLREWQAIRKQWDISQFTNEKGIIRRSLTGERNLRPRFKVDWSKPRHRFQAAFDVFCMRWNLYGMEGDKPLTMKFSVNLTPYGTMIFIPVYWSFDAKRDVRWDEVMKLHRARALKKQGEGLADGIEQRRAHAAKLQVLDAEVKRMKLQGAAAHAFRCKGLGLVEGTDPKRLARLRREFGKSA